MSEEEFSDDLSKEESSFSSNTAMDISLSASSSTTEDENSDTGKGTVQNEDGHAGGQRRRPKMWRCYLWLFYFQF